MTTNTIIIGILVLILLFAWTSSPVREGMKLGGDASNKSFPHLLAIQQNIHMLNDAIEKTKAVSRANIKSEDREKVINYLQIVKTSFENWMTSQFAFIKSGKGESTPLKTVWEDNKSMLESANEALDEKDAKQETIMSLLDAIANNTNIELRLDE
jgi:hypothetical protein